ncbi:MAG: SRPBCC domain-containing protein [Egibacteraceae bacterium]
MAKVTRTVVLPATPSQVWHSVGSPDRLSRWLGVDIELDVRPGGEGTAREPDGTTRRLVVDDVQPGARLSFSWWPEPRGHGPDASTASRPGSAAPAAGPASAVEIDLEPVDGGTRLRVTETALPAIASFASAQAPRAMASAIA